MTQIVSNFHDLFNSVVGWGVKLYLSHSSILPTCFTSSSEPSPYITQNSSSESFTPLSGTFIWTCRF